MTRRVDISVDEIIRNLRQQLAEAMQERDEAKRAVEWLAEKYSETLAEINELLERGVALQKDLMAKWDERDKLASRLAKRNPTPRTVSLDAMLRYAHDHKGWSYEQIAKYFPQLGLDRQNVRDAVRRARKRGHPTFLGNG
jgi:chromosome segregation ATPase